VNNTTGRRFARYIALPAVSVGILGGAALGMAGMANASTTATPPAPRVGIVATHQTRATPSTTLSPGQWHRHHNTVALQLAGE
jgi:hypothetical protein